jgi:hypothetical protein
LWRALAVEKESGQGSMSDRFVFGVLLGCFGALIGFFTSGLVHYNIGDGEVAMVFYLLMAVGMRTSEFVGVRHPVDTPVQHVEYKMAA